MPEQPETRDPLKAFSDAYAAYQAALLAICFPADLHQRARDVQSGFLAAGNDPLKQFEAMQQFVATANEVRNPQRITSATAKAYRDFVYAIQRAWAQVDPNAIEPAQLLTICRGIACAAWLAATTNTST